jgi:HK97 gp10 family phage protein
MTIAEGRTNFRKGCMKGLQLSGRLVRDRIRKLIKDPPKTGRKYPSLKNRSSAVGEAPAYQSGKLSRGVRYAVSGWSKMEVGDTVFYGYFLEYGTTKMKPRPHVSTAVSDTFKTVEIIITMSINERLKIK